MAQKPFKCKTDVFEGKTKLLAFTPSLSLSRGLPASCFLLRGRVLRPYRQALRTARRAPDHSRAELKRDCKDKQRIRSLISEGTKRLKSMTEMLGMQGHC
ncbi:hypothetical protein CRYUN_Cryun27aG0111400 [Craigia yunnanensis]